MFLIVGVTGRKRASNFDDGGISIGRKDLLEVSQAMLVGHQIVEKNQSAMVGLPCWRGLLWNRRALGRIKPLPTMFTFDRSRFNRLGAVGARYVRSHSWSSPYRPSRLRHHAQAHSTETEMLWVSKARARGTPTTDAPPVPGCRSSPPESLPCGSRSRAMGPG